MSRTLGPRANARSPANSGRPFSAPLRGGRSPRHSSAEEFRCRHCKLMVGPTISGGSNRNHCPFCLWSRHVDDKTPGDRASDCRSSMEPIGVFQRPKGEEVIVHRCLGCGLERYNRVAADDSFALVEALPVVSPRRTAWSTSLA